MADVFKAFESEDPNTVVECHPLRIALSEEDKDGRFFQLNQMDDAVECYEEVRGFPPRHPLYYCFWMCHNSKKTNVNNRSSAACTRARRAHRHQRWSLDE